MINTFDFESTISAFKVSYDPILRKIDKEIRNLTNKQEEKPTGGAKTLKTNSWSPKSMDNFNNINNKAIKSALQSKFQILAPI